MTVNNKYPSEKLFLYTIGEDIANALSHIVGSVFGIFALISLTWVAAKYSNDKVDTFAFVFYGLTILFMFLMSSLYHSMLNYKARLIFKKLDHIAIYLLILGSYTPFVFSLVKTKISYIIYAIILVIAILGIIYKSLKITSSKKISTIVYLIMGWGGLWLLPQAFKILPNIGSWYLVAGGMAYTIGAIVYAVLKFKFSHMVWHIFVFFGVLFQFITINYFILQYR